MNIRLSAFFLQYLYYIRMRGLVRTADPQIDDLRTLPVQLLDLAKLLRKIIFAYAFQSVRNLHLDIFSFFIFQRLRF